MPVEGADNGRGDTGRGDDASRWRERYAMLLRIAGDGVAEIDVSTGAVWWSPGLMATLGYTERTFGGTFDWAMDQLIHPDDRDRVAALAISGGDESTTLMRLRHANGEYRVMRARSALERDANGNVVRRLTSYTDVTEQERAEARRVALARDLHETVIQHLAAVRASAGGLGSMPGSGPEALRRTLRELLAQLSAAEENMHLVVRALREDTSLLEPRGSVSALSETLASELSARDPRLEVVLENRFPEEAELRSPGPAVLAHILREALLNVLQHASADRVGITLSEEAGTMRMEVGDDGVGFDPGAWRAVRLLRRLRGRADAAGGTVELITSPGAGTQLVLTLPLEHDGSGPTDGGGRARGAGAPGREPG